MEKYIGITAAVISILAIPPAILTGLGVMVALLSLIIAGIAASMKELQYSAFTAVITTINIFGISVFTISSQSWNYESLIVIGVPYFLYIIGLIVGILRVKYSDGLHK